MELRTLLIYSIALGAIRLQPVVQGSTTELPKAAPSTEDTPINICRSSDTPIPTPPVTCESCKSRCGDTFNPGRKCVCNPSCVAYGDCCMDFEESCPDEFTASISLRKHFKYRKTKCQSVRVALNEYGIPQSEDLTFVAVCGQTGYICNSTSPYNLLEPNLAVPVTDTDSGVTYMLTTIVPNAMVSEM